MQLLNAIRVHPDPAAATADVAPTGGDRVGAFDTDVGLVEVQCLPKLDPTIAQALQVELMEEREAVYMFSKERSSVVIPAPS